MVSGPTEPNSSIVPSAGPLATCWCAMLPPAPSLLSTTPVCPMFSPSFLAIRRAAASAAPPAAKPTTSVTDFLGGKSCAWLGPLSNSAAKASAVACSRWDLFIADLRKECCEWSSVGRQTDRVGLELFDRMPQQGRAAEDAVTELAVGQRGEQGHHRAKVQAQQHGQGGRAAAQPECQSAGAGEEQQGNESQVHRSLYGVAMQGMAPAVQVPQPCRADHQAHTADHAEQLGQAGQFVGRRPAERVVVDRRHAGRRKAQQEAIESEVVKAPTREGEGVVVVVAAHTMATVEV